MSNKYFKTLVYFAFISSFAFLFGCKKYLDAKSSKSLQEPNTLEGLQGLMDLYYWVNNVDVGYGIDGADDFYYKEDRYNSLTSEQDRNRYIWADYDVITTGLSAYTYAFDGIYRANTVLEGISKISRSIENARTWDNIKGQALYLRGKNYYMTAQVWTLAYDRSTSNKDLGMPLRLNTNFNEVSVRSSNEETYLQIISDLKGAVNLLPVEPVHPYRSSKPAALGMLARTYLSMREYDSCLYYVNKALEFKSLLLDYNMLDSSATYPFKQFGVEVIMDNALYVSMSRKTVDSVLFSMYGSNDLRKSLFFNSNGDGSFKFGGSYEGNANVFGGVATDELYLMKAECEVRLGNVAKAKEEMDILLKKRYLKGTYISFASVDAQQILNWILAERRKELVGRGLRWTDIKRLNKEGANITLKRVIGSNVYYLAPNDPRYAMAFPDNVINISGMKQNPR